jgi:DNA-binding MarR family transcriptional regulator
MGDDVRRPAAGRRLVALRHDNARNGAPAVMNRSTAERDQLASTGAACGSPAGAAAATTRIRELLNRRELAATRHRLAIRRGMTLDEPDMLTLAHLALDGQLTPSQLRHALGYSSGGIDAVERRLERDGHVTRHANPTDGRSRLIRPAPAVVRAAAAGFAPRPGAPYRRRRRSSARCARDKRESPVGCRRRPPRTNGTSAGPPPAGCCFACDCERVRVWRRRPTVREDLHVGARASPCSRSGVGLRDGHAADPPLRGRDVSPCSTLRTRRRS